MRVLGHPVKYSAAETPVRRPSPDLGEHNREVLLEFGYDSAEIDAFEESGAIGGSSGGS